MASKQPVAPAPTPRNRERFSDPMSCVTLNCQSLPVLLPDMELSPLIPQPVNLAHVAIVKLPVNCREAGCPRFTSLRLLLKKRAPAFTPPEEFQAGMVPPPDSSVPDRPFP